MKGLWFFVALLFVCVCAPPLVDAACVGGRCGFSFRKPILSNVRPIHRVTTKYRCRGGDCR